MLHERAILICVECGESSVQHIDKKNVLALAQASGWFRMPNRHRDDHHWRCPICIAADRAERDCADKFNPDCSCTPGQHDDQSEELSSQDGHELNRHNERIARGR